MHGATVSSPFEIPTSVEGVAQSTSQVTQRMSACLLATRSRASARVRDGFSWSFSTMNSSLRPSTPPCALIFATSSFAAASAGPSKNFIVLLRSIAAPMMIGFFELLALLELLLVLLLLLLLLPHAATASAAAPTASTISADLLSLLICTPRFEPSQSDRLGRLLR